MSDDLQGDRWWLASDGKWYPPDLHPSFRGTTSDEDRNAALLSATIGVARVRASVVAGVLGERMPATWAADVAVEATRGVLAPARSGERVPPRTGEPVPRSGSGRSPVPRWKPATEPERPARGPHRRHLSGRRPSRRCRLRRRPGSRARPGSCSPRCHRRRARPHTPRCLRNRRRPLRCEPISRLSRRRSPLRRALRRRRRAPLRCARGASSPEREATSFKGPLDLVSPRCGCRRRRSRCCAGSPHTSRFRRGGGARRGRSAFGSRVDLSRFPRSRGGVLEPGRCSPRRTRSSGVGARPGGASGRAPVRELRSGSLAGHDDDGRGA